MATKPGSKYEAVPSFNDYRGSGGGRFAFSAGVSQTLFSLRSEDTIAVVCNRTVALRYLSFFSYFMDALRLLFVIVTFSGLWTVTGSGCMIFLMIPIFLTLSVMRY